MLEKFFQQQKKELTSSAVVEARRHRLKIIQKKLFNLSTPIFRFLAI